MKTQATFLLVATLLYAGSGFSETVSREASDTTPGKGVGGFSGFMAGAVAGGPVGAVVGAGIGWLVGGETQQATGLGGTAYEVTNKDGSRTTVRSPGRRFSPGDEVRIVNRRLVAGDRDIQSSRSVSAGL